MSDAKTVSDVLTVEEIQNDWGPFKSIKGFDVCCAHLHQGAPIPGCSVLTTLQTLKNNPTTKSRGIEMKFTTLGLACKILNKNSKKMEFFMIPHANLIITFSE